MQNFTVADTLGTLAACLALLPFMIAPGYVAGWTLNLFEFRQHRQILRLIVSAPLSIAICPMLSYLLARFFQPGLWAFYIGVILACVLLLAKAARQSRQRSSSPRSSSRNLSIAFALLALWAVLAFASLVDLQLGDRLYPSIVAYDHSVRTAMTVALARHIPPANPFFANADAPLRYHYLWLLFCSLPMRVFPLAARHIVNAGIIWCGLALMCTVALGLRFLENAHSRIERKVLLGITLLCVTGLDIVPTLYIGLVQHLWLSDMEWWNETQITSWVGSVLWVPHNIAALIACFVGFSLLRHQADAHRRWITAPVLVAGMAFASAVGMSIYVTLTFVVAVGLWLLALLARKNWLELAMFVASGGVALLWALSFLFSLRGPATGGAFAEFALRPFSLGTYFLQRLGVHFTTPFVVTVANAIFLPINYALELGFFLAVALVRLWRLKRSEVAPSANELASWTLIASSFLVGTFLRSSTIGSNDLGWRCFLPAQLILLLWGATLVDECWFQPQAASRQGIRGLLAALLLLGAMATTYQVFMLRMDPILVDRGSITGPSWVVANRQFGKRAFALRSVYETLDAHLPASAVLQANPATDDLILHMLYSGRDSAAGDGDCGTDFGGDEDLCSDRLERLDALFKLPDGNDLDATCRDYGIDAFVVEDADPVWREPNSWVWSKRPSLANAYVRAFRCGSAAQGDRP